MKHLMGHVVQPLLDDTERTQPIRHISFNRRRPCPTKKAGIGIVPHVCSLTRLHSVCMTRVQTRDFEVTQSLR